jgi:hypothetical protein
MNFLELENNYAPGIGMKNQLNNHSFLRSSGLSRFPPIVFPLSYTALKLHAKICHLV